MREQRERAECERERGERGKSVFVEERSGVLITGDGHESADGGRDDFGGAADRSRGTGAVRLFV